MRVRLRGDSQFVKRAAIAVTMTHVAICAPSTPLTRETAEAVRALAAQQCPQVSLHFHEQCFAEHGHFAGDDSLRAGAMLECANDPAFDAVWFARGGYGACRIVDAVVAGLNDAAREKKYLGYSDAGYLLAALYRAGKGTPVHGPMPADIRREGGEAAVLRALAWLVAQDRTTLDSNIDPRPHAAFNAMTLAMMTGTPIMPDLQGHVVMIEEVSEYLYALDRAMFHITGNLKDAGIAGIRLGRVSDVPENDRPFGEDAEAITQRWCKLTGIAYLGRADIGHDADNKIVPFGNRAI